MTNRSNLSKERELAISIIEEFENLLDSKGVVVPSEDRKDIDEPSCICGKEYYSLEDAVTALVRNYKLDIIASYLKSN